MPEPKRKAKARRFRMHQWVVGGVGFLGLLVILCILTHKMWGVGPNPLGNELNDARDRIRASGLNVKMLKKQLVAARWKLDTFRGVGKQPDWSVVLTMLADGLGSDVVLKSCELGDAAMTVNTLPTARGPVKSHTVGLTEEQKQMRFVMGVAGFGRSQTAVSQFVLRLERSGLFDSVRIVSTIREPFLDDKAIAFRLECRLGGEDNNGGGSNEI
jgi:Tfp pilus assembly protein PilN